MNSLYKIGTLIFVLTLLNGCGGEENSRSSDMTSKATPSSSNDSLTRSSTAKQHSSEIPVTNTLASLSHNVAPIMDCEKGRDTLVLSEGESCMDEGDFLECHNGVITLNSRKESKNSLEINGKKYSCQ